MNRRHSSSHHHNPEDKSTLERFLGVIVGLQWWLLLALGLAGGVFYYRQPIPEPKELQTSIKRLRAEKLALEVEHDKLVNRVEWAKNDDAYLEVIARDRLNKQKDGEVIVRFKD
jgi:cell division protein FtsB